MNMPITGPEKIINLDGDNTTTFGSLSWSTLTKAAFGEYPGVIGFRHPDDLSEILDREHDPLKSFNPKQLFANINYSDTLRPIHPGVEGTLMKFKDRFGPRGVNILSGRDLETLLIRTLENLNKFGILQQVDGVMLKPHGFSSAEWKANVLYYQAKQNPKSEIILVDNDIVACIAIGEALLAVKAFNVKIYLKQTLETNETLRKLLRIKPLPSNVEIFSDFTDLENRILNTEG